jgi:hypothetical protein
MEGIDDWEDAFGNQLTRNTRVNADLAAHSSFPIPMETSLPRRLIPAAIY